MDLPAWESRHKAEVSEKPPLPLVTQIAETLPPGKGLDLACGTGRHALWLAQRGWNVTAVDGSPAAISILQKRKGELAIDTRVANLERHEYSIEPEAWDLILISLYLQHDLFERAKRGVKKGGILIAIVLLSDTENPRKHSVRPGELKAYFDGWDILHYSEDSQARIACKKT